MKRLGLTGLVQVFSRKPLAPVIVFSSLFAFSCVVGLRIYNNIAFKDSGIFFYVIITILGFIVPFAFIQISISFLQNRNAANRKILKSFPGWFWLVEWVVMFVSWLPCLLAYWPGLFTYDMPAQTEQALTGNYNTWHPLMHTLYWGACLRIGWFLGIEPITVYAVGQMTLLSFAFSRVLKLLQDRMPRWVVIASLAFFALNPVIAIMAITPTKDVPFAALLCLLVICVVKLARDPQGFLTDWKEVLLLEALVVACCLFRNNAPFAFVLIAPVAAALTDGCRFKVAGAFLIPAVTAALVMGPVLDSVGLKSEREWEAFSVPMQQVAYVAKESGYEISELMKSRIDEFLPYEKMTEKFNPRFADPVKRLFRSSDKAAFIALWAELGIDYPKEYVREFFELNIPYWYMFATDIDPLSKREYIELDLGDRKCEYYSVDYANAFPALKGWYDSVADESLVARLPLLAPLFSISLPIWIMLASACLLLTDGERRFVLVPLIPICVWVTYLFGPVSILRYVFPIMCLYPILIACAFYPRNVFVDNPRCPIPNVL